MEQSENTLNINLSAASLFKYALPTILSVIFMNIYSIVDQLFVSNVLGTDALSAVSIASPFLAIALAIGTMIATGGCALVSNLMGEGKNEEARSNFSFFMLFGVVISTAFCIVGIVFREPILHAMGADSGLYALCEAYAVPIFVLLPFAMASIVMQLFFVAAGKPGLGFALSIMGGVINIVLDYVLLVRFPMGVAGAAYATAAGYILQSVAGCVFFAANRKAVLYFTRPKFDGRALIKACSNGMSEMVSMLAITITMIAMNVILMNLVGSDGVAAGAIVLSAQTILAAAYEGYVQGIAPVISFKYGAGKSAELNMLYRIAVKTVAVMAVITLALAFVLAKPIAGLFAEGNRHVMELAVKGINIFAAAFLFMGFNLFASGFFTALNDGKTSAVISLFRTLIFLIIPMLILPAILGVNGVWVSMPVAEVLSFILALFLLKKMRAKYNY